MADPARTMRWLCCPLLLVVGHWVLLLKTAAVVALVPRLWATGGKGVRDVLRLFPKTKSQAFELGWQAHYASLRCGHADAASTGECARALQLAGDAVGSSEPLTLEQLAGMRDLLVELDAQRSVGDRILGFFSFVNIVWAVSIMGIVATVLPCAYYIFGRQLAMLAVAFVQQVLLPLLRMLHHLGALEVAGYALAFSVSAQSARYPDGQQSAAAMVGLSGGLLLLPLGFYTMSRYAKDGRLDLGVGEQTLMMLCAALLSGTLAPLALLHDSHLIGFLTVLSVFVGLGFFVQGFFFGFVIGFQSESAIDRCMSASLLLILFFTVFRVVGVDPRFVRPFALGAMCLGNVMWFLALLVRCSSGLRDDSGWSKHAFWQCIMLCSIVLALLVGNVFVLPSMSNTACTFLVLWMLQKQWEINWKEASIVVLFANFVALYFMAHYLHTHPEVITSLVDPNGMYVSA